MTMQKQVIYDRWCVIETSNGTVAIQLDLIGKTLHPTAKEISRFIEGEFLSCSIVDGYGARLSMPGYLDCTEWTVFPSEEQAYRFLTETFDND